MSDSTRSGVPGRELGVLGREADVRVQGAKASGTRTGAAQCVRIAQPGREIVESLI